MPKTLEIFFRTVTLDDAKELIEIYSPYVQNTAISFEYEVPSVEEFKSRISNILQKYPYIVAIHNSKIVGYAYASAFKTREAYKYSVEMSIYVRKDFRHCGIGHQLYEKMEQILFAQGILNLNACITCADENENPYVTNNSINFHKREGYTLVGRFTKCGFKFGQWFNMCWMEKLLDGGINRNENPQVFLPFNQVKNQFGL